MILNQNKTMVVVWRSRTVSPPHGDLALSGISVVANPNHDIHGMKFDSELTFEDHVRGIDFHVSQRIGILRLVKRIFGHTSLLLRFYFEFAVPNLDYCSPVWGQWLNVTFSFLSIRSFAQDSVSCCCVYDVVLLGLVCCRRLIQTLITFCSSS